MATIRPDEITEVLRRELGGFEAEADVYEVLDVRQCIAARRSLGGTAPAEVEKGLERAKKLLAQAGSPGGA
ncbi:MAG: hypothetical protein LOD91_06390 [Limnochordales bacterium]